MVANSPQRKVHHVLFSKCFTCVCFIDMSNKEVKYVQIVPIVTWIHDPNHGILELLQMRQSPTQKNGLRWRTGQQQGPRPQVGDLHSSWTVWWPASSWPRWGRAASEPRSSRGWAPEPQGPIHPHSSKVSVGGTFPEGQITKPKDKKNAHHAAATLALSSMVQKERKTPDKVMWTS